MSAVPAPVRAEIGLAYMLPHSFTQMGVRMSVGVSLRTPAARNASASASTRGDRDPSGSPKISRSTPATWETPGSGEKLELCSTQPITRSGGRAFAIRPPASTLSSRVPSRAPPNRWKNHQGTPFMALTTALSACSRGASRGATSGRAWALRETIR